VTAVLQKERGKSYSHQTTVQSKKRVTQKNRSGQRKEKANACLEQPSPVFGGTYCTMEIESRLAAPSVGEGMKSVIDNRCLV